MVGDPQFTYCMQQDEPWGCDSNLLDLIHA
jgi:hypothetical protein